MSENTNKDISLDLIHILFEEWKFRLNQYWSITSKTVILNFILFFIPYMKGAWRINTLNLPIVVFPISGILFALATCVISTVEMIKINKIKDTIKTYILDNCHTLFTAYSFGKKDNKSFFLKSHHYIPICIFIVQFLIGIIVYLSIK